MYTGTVTLGSSCLERSLFPFPCQVSWLDSSWVEVRRAIAAVDQGFKSCSVLPLNVPGLCMSSGSPQGWRASVFG